MARRDETWRNLGIALKVGIAFAVAFAIVSFKARRRSAPSFITPADTAAYSNLIHAAKMVTGLPELPDRAAFLADNKETFEVARRALAHRVEAPESIYDPTIGSIGLADYSMCKRLAHALNEEALKAASERRYKDAADTCFDILELGEQTSHGPLIYVTTGISIEYIALKTMAMIAPALSNDEIRVIAARLQKHNRERITFSEIRDRYYYLQEVHSTNMIDLARHRFSKQSRSTLEKVELTHLKLRAHVEIAAAALAAIRYAREKGAPPSDVSALTPSYLPTIPIDPFTRVPLRARSYTNGAMIYSVGPNKQDEKGGGDDVTAR